VSQNIPLNYSDPALEAFFDATQEMLGAAAPGFLLDLADATTIRLVAGEGNAQRSIAIEGKYRYARETVTRAHPGGAAGTYIAWATAAANRFTGPAGPTLDQTDYRFALAITAGARPTGVDLARDVASVEWDGSKITAIDHRVGPAAGTARHRSTHAVGGTDPVTPAMIGAAPAAASMPLGGVLDWPWNASPPGPAVWLPCDGRSIPRTDYPELSAIVGGTGPTMTLQDRRGRVPVGAGTGTNLSSRQIGDMGGEQSHQLTIDEMPSHDHPRIASGSVGPPGVDGGVDLLGDRSRASVQQSTGERLRGGNGYHNNMQPFTVTSFYTRVR
jgi:microcystin-dependent protein